MPLQPEQVCIQWVAVVGFVTKQILGIGFNM